MITTVKEFENTYVKNTPELREAFLSTALRLGLIGSISAVGRSSEDAVVAYWHDVDGCNFNVGCWRAYAGQIRNECRELTLSDLKEKKQMKIDYELAEKIGATHYSEKSGKFYKVVGNDFILFNGSFWVVSELTAEDAIPYIKPIPKPLTRTEYEKVTESIFDLREEFEGGELYGDNIGVTKIEKLAHLGACVQHGLIYRKVQKPVDWREEVCAEFDSLVKTGVGVEFPCRTQFTSNGFINLCRVTLRALGEL